VTEHALPSWLVVDTTVLRHFERLVRLTKDFSGASDNPLLPLMYWLGQETNDQLLDLLNARLDQSPQLSRIQAWRAFRDELEHQNHKWANRSDDVPPLPADEITPREHTQHDMRYVGLILLMFLSWLVYFVGPAVISDVPSDHTMSATDYYGLVPALAVALTGAVLAGRKHNDE
jgi:hypothetical protein